MTEPVEKNISSEIGIEYSAKNNFSISKHNMKQNFLDRFSLIIIEVDGSELSIKIIPH